MRSLFTLSCLLLVGAAGCQDDPSDRSARSSDPRDTRDEPRHPRDDHGDEAHDVPDDEPAPSGPERAPEADMPAAVAPTYFQDVLPIFESHCLGCHREGGSGPFRLDTYASARDHAEAIAQATSARTMPPSYILADGSCRDFADVNQLSDAEIDTIGAWARADAPEGAARAARVPAATRLDQANTYETPPYAPVAIGGELAAHDDYHCFVFDANVLTEQFVTGFDVEPGSPSVHHVIAYLVDPRAPSLVAGVSNGDALALHDATSPLVPGWTCLMDAGEMVATKPMRATWLPGQDAQQLPNQSGVRIAPGDKVVLQVHYNLGSHGGDDTHGAGAAPTPARGREVVSRLRFGLARQVANEGFFVAGDGLLSSLSSRAPAVLAAGRKSETFRWSHRLRELGWLQPIGELWGIYPHMHQLGSRYAARFDAFSGPALCIADVPRWNYHWQRMYSYASPLLVTPDTQLTVTCDYDTSSRTEPVLPGMGTENEMCGAILYLTVPSRPGL